MERLKRKRKPKKRVAEKVKEKALGVGQKLYTPGAKNQQSNYVGEVLATVESGAAGWAMVEWRGKWTIYEYRTDCHLTYNTYGKNIPPSLMRRLVRQATERQEGAEDGD